VFLTSLIVAHAGTVLEPADGRAALPERPAFTLWTEPAPAAGAPLDQLRAELDMAWEQRAQLDNEDATSRIELLLPRLLPTLDEGSGDLLADALYLQGVLQLDESAGFGAPGDAVVVGGQPVPRPWVQAMALRPGRPPTSPGEAFRQQVYEQVRTVLLTVGGTELDLGGAGEVRVDGAVAQGPVTVLPGRHTLSWHPIGAPVRAGVFDNEGLEQLARDLDALRHTATGQADVPDALAALLWQELGTPQVTLRDGDGHHTLRMLAPSSAVAPSAHLGVAFGAAAWSQQGFPRPDPCGTTAADGPVKLLVPIGLRAATRAEAWFAEAQIGLVTGLTAESAWAMDQPTTCTDGSTAELTMLRALPLLGGAVGLSWDTPLGQLGPSLGLTTSIAHANVDLGVRTHGERLGVALYAGPTLSQAAPAWRGGLELSLWQTL